MFMILGECRKNYRQQIRMLNVILIVKENRIWHLNGYRNFYCLWYCEEKEKNSEEEQLLMMKTQ